MAQSAHQQCVTELVQAVVENLSFRTVMNTIWCCRHVSATTVPSAVVLIYLLRIFLTYLLLCVEGDGKRAET